MRLIDADALIKAIIQMPPNSVVFDCIHDAPTIDPERKKGEWILAEDGWYCSVCELYPPFDCDPEEKGIPYCPHCGADMRKPKLQYGDADTLQGGLMSAT